MTLELNYHESGTICSLNGKVLCSETNLSSFDKIKEKMECMVKVDNSARILELELGLPGSCEAILKHLELLGWAVSDQSAVADASGRSQHVARLRWKNKMPFVIAVYVKPEPVVLAVQVGEQVVHCDHDEWLANVESAVFLVGFSAENEIYKKELYASSVRIMESIALRRHWATHSTLSQESDVLTKFGMSFFVKSGKENHRHGFVVQCRVVLSNEAKGEPYIAVNAAGETQKMQEVRLTYVPMPRLDGTGVDVLFGYAEFIRNFNLHSNAMKIFEVSRIYCRQEMMMAFKKLHSTLEAKGWNTRHHGIVLDPDSTTQGKSFTFEIFGFRHKSFKNHFDVLVDIVENSSAAHLVAHVKHPETAREFELRNSNDMFFYSAWLREIHNYLLRCTFYIRSFTSKMQCKCATPG